MIDVFGVTPSCRINLDANDRAEDRENDQQREGRGGECRGVRLIGRLVLRCHFLLPIARYALHHLFVRAEQLERDDFIPL